MEHLSKAYRLAPGLFIILLFGLVVEGANFENSFYRFMAQYRPDWGAVNHIFSLFLASFILFNIVEWGMRNKKELSYGIALITVFVSFSVYSSIELQWQFNELNELHIVILILSVGLPLAVAYTTHEIRKVIDLNDTSNNANPLPITNGTPVNVASAKKKVVI